MSEARDVVLGRIRAALGEGGAAPEVPRGYRQAGSAEGGPGMADRFCERVAEYRATVRRVQESRVPEEVAAVCRERGTRRLAVAPGAPWVVEGVEPVDGGAMAPGDLDAVDGVLTGCALAVADTGTIVLDSSPVCGPRALTLVPDHHVCVVFESQIVAGVPDAVAALREAALAGRPITMVSGPSATSDIELQRVEGMHGPRRLDVIVAAG